MTPANGRMVDVSRDVRAGAPPSRPVQVDGLEIHEVGDGLLVYQPHPECVHHLNGTAAVVFCLCTGERTLAEIGDQVASAFGLGEPPMAIVAACVSELRAKGAIR